MPKLAKRIIAGILGELLIRGTVSGNGDIILLVACNLLVLGIIFYAELLTIMARIGQQIASLHRYTPAVLQQARKLLLYLFQHYLLVISFVLLFVSILDRLFISYFYLPLGWCLFFVVVSVLVLLPQVIEKKFYFAEHRLDKKDFTRGALVLFLIAMLITLRFLPLQQTYFYSLLATSGIYIAGFFIVEKKGVGSLWHRGFFQIIAGLTVLAGLAFLRQLLF